jgi:hypothetical protein
MSKKNLHIILIFIKVRTILIVFLRFCFVYVFDSRACDIQ